MFYVQKWQNSVLLTSFLKKIKKLKSAVGCRMSFGLPAQYVHIAFNRLFCVFCWQVRLLYKGTLRVLLVLLHDFPEFLCDHHFTFCDVIPPSCIQMRNLILSAFPRNMRLPDPFTPNLKVYPIYMFHVH